MLTPESVIDRLYGTFYPIHTKWLEWRPHDSALWERYQSQSAAVLMEEDIRHIGIHFASADNIGARTEYALIAECVAFLRARAGKPLSGAMMEEEIDLIYHGLTQTREHEIKPPIHQHTPFRAPVSWRIAQAMAASGRSSDAAIEALISSFTDLAHLFLLRDGNITPEEDIQLARFHAAFDG